jgi:DNA-binding NarL/FixJ family response regulator
MGYISDTMGACSALLEKYKHWAGEAPLNKSKVKKVADRLPINNTEKDAILTLYTQGKSRHAIAKATGRTNYEIDKVVVAVVPQTMLRKKVIFPEDYTATVVSMRQRGMTYRQIGDQLQISTASAFRLGNDA